MSGADPTGLICISEDWRNALSGAAGSGVAGALASRGKPWPTIGATLLGGVAGYVGGEAWGGAVAGAISGGSTTPGGGFSLRAASVAGVTGGLAGAEGTWFGGAVGGAYEGFFNGNVGRRFVDERSWYGSGVGHAVRGTFFGALSGGASELVGELVEANNRSAGNCSCRK